MITNVLHKNVTRSIHGVNYESTIKTFKIENKNLINQTRLTLSYFDKKLNVKKNPTSFENRVL